MFFLVKLARIKINLLTSSFILVPEVNKNVQLINPFSINGV
jgi:hypothetical protein